MWNNQVYDKMKWIAQYFLPALATLIFAIWQVWNLPYGTQVIGTITAIDTFLGILLGISSASYSGDGTMIIDTSNSAMDIYRMELDSPIEDLNRKSQVTFNVKTIMK